jgi:periplasmic protein TonB
MAYEALLFCPDEKTARTVTQVLAELEFGVEPCTEPFGAVKKLMSQHFDAIVVDCDNEQNATLLFKSARNSTSNQASLAVAIVEGQAGVAKAFRIGANLVLTKPINVEQSKGTLRVARGLLRKGEPGKPAATPSPAPATPAAAAPRPLATKPMSAAKPAASAAIGMRQPPEPKPAAVPPARPAIPPVAAKAAAPAPQIPTSATGAFAPTPVSKAAPASLNTPAPSTIPSLSISTSGAASAPAPAREAQVPEAVPAVEPKHAEAVKTDEAKASIAKSAEPVLPKAEPAVPSFTFGGAAIAEPSSGSGKKVIIGLVAAIVIAAGAYAGWTYLGHRSQSATRVTPQTTVAPAPQSAGQPASQPAAPSRAEATAPLSALPPSHEDLNAQDSHSTVKAETNEFGEAKPEKSAHADKGSAKDSAKPSAVPTSNEMPAIEPEAAAPLVVKSGEQPHAHAAAPADEPAPSVIGMATPSSDAPLSGIVADQPTAKPVLQKMKISQGIAQGLVVKRVAPEYPKNALILRIEGAVELAATISKDGEIKDVKVLSGNPQLTHAAVQAVRQWKYKPYLLDGEPVEIQTQITIDFKLPQ